jgi:ATP/maltotriose-dependent transcriptional regulator MalT
MGRAAFNDGDIETAKSEIKRAKAQAEKTERRPGGVLALELECQVNLENGDFDQALQSADRGLSLAELLNYKPMVWRLRVLRAQVLTKLGRHGEAKDERIKAAVVIKEMAGHIRDENLRNAFLGSPSFSHLPLEGELEG